MEFKTLKALFCLTLVSLGSPLARADEFSNNGQTVPAGANPGGGASPAPAAPAAPAPAPQAAPPAEPAKPPTADAPAAKIDAPVAVQQLNSAAQVAAANPMDAAARQNLSMAGINAMRANAAIDRAADSGQYDSRDRDDVKRKNAFALVKNFLAAQQPTSGGASQQSSKTSAALDRRSAREPASQPAGNSATQIQSFSPAVTVSVALQFSDPLVPPKAAATQVLNDIKSAVPVLSLADFSGRLPDKPGAQFVTTLVEIIREVGAKTKEAEKTAKTGDQPLSKDDKSGRDTVRLDEDAQTSAVAAADQSSSELTKDQKEDLEDFVLSALAVTAAKAKKEIGPNDSKEVEEFRAAAKSALRDETITDALATDIAAAVADFVANDRESHGVLSSRSAKRDLNRKISDWNNAGKNNPGVNRALASTKEASAEFSNELSDPKNLILLALFTLLALLGLSGRRRQN